jgi:hypothetical protein
MRTILVFVSFVAALALAGCVTKHRASPAVQGQGLPIVLTNEPPELRPYEEALLNAVQDRWYALFDSLAPSEKPSGKVLVSCKLNSNGHITDVVVLENTCNPKCALICKQAILDPSPYPPWPEPMQKKVEDGYIAMTLTFVFDRGTATQMQRTGR